ncbi:Neugrin-domain-containing protein [Paraphysoderma sedebokerense]|nr:Neugrin-domain-containing protein [Paraphysoderma sedebokerense]
MSQLKKIIHISRLSNPIVQHLIHHPLIYRSSLSSSSWSRRFPISNIVLPVSKRSLATQQLRIQESDADNYGVHLSTTNSESKLAVNRPTSVSESNTHSTKFLFLANPIELIESSSLNASHQKRSSKFKSGQSSNDVVNTVNSGSTGSDTLSSFSQSSLRGRTGKRNGEILISNEILEKLGVNENDVLVDEAATAMKSKSAEGRSTVESSETKPTPKFRVRKRRVQSNDKGLSSASPSLSSNSPSPPSSSSKFTQPSPPTSRSCSTSTLSQPSLQPSSTSQSPTLVTSSSTSTSQPITSLPKLSIPKDFAEWKRQKLLSKQSRNSEPWCPKKRLSRNDMEKIRFLHRELPNQHTIPHLSSQFKVSYETIKRILRSKFAPTIETIQRQESKRKSQRESYVKELIGNLQSNSGSHSTSTRKQNSKSNIKINSPSTRQTISASELKFNTPKSTHNRPSSHHPQRNRLEFSKTGEPKTLKSQVQKYNVNHRVTLDTKNRGAKKKIELNDELILKALS